MSVFKELLILGLLAPFAPVLFVLGLFEVKWAVQLMNPGADLDYVPTREELNYLEAFIEEQKAKNRAASAQAAAQDSVGWRVNPATGLSIPPGSAVDSGGSFYGSSNNND